MVGKGGRQKGTLSRTKPVHLEFYRSESLGPSCMVSGFDFYYLLRQSRSVCLVLVSSGRTRLVNLVTWWYVRCLWPTSVLTIHVKEALVHENNWIHHLWRNVRLLKENRTVTTTVLFLGYFFLFICLLVTSLTKKLTYFEGCSLFHTSLLEKSL